jgi:O-antigen ligase
MIIFSNPVVYTYFYDFLIFGALPLLLLMRISKLDWFFKYMAYLAVPIILLMGLDPINQYAITSNYMIYGYAVMLPSFMGLFIARKLFGLKWTLPFEIISFSFLVLYANQGAILSGLALVAMYKIFVEKFDKKTLYLNLSILFVIVLAFINLRSILETGIGITKSYGGYSYALEKTYGSFYGNTDGLSGRGFYWDNAIQMYNERPITGSGIASFESRYGIYTHNIFLETAVSLGIFGLILLIIFLSYYLYRMLGTEREYRLLYVLGISIGLLPLMFSLQPFIWCYLWIFTLNPRHNILGTKYNYKIVGGSNE